MKNLLLLITATLFLVSCNQGEKKTEQTETPTETEVTASILTVKDVLDTPDKYKDTEVKISGMVTHVCAHGGQKLFIIGDDPEMQLRITVGEGIPEFDMALEGSSVEFTGTVKILEPEVTEELAMENEEKDHHTGDEAHAEAESASYYIEATGFKEITAEL